MRGILIIWVTCGLMLASVSRVTSSSTAQTTTTTTTPPPTTTTTTPPPTTTTTTPPPTTTTTTTTSAATTSLTTVSTTTKTATGPTTATASTGSTTSTTASTGSTTSTTASTGPTTTSGTTSTSNSTDVETTTSGNETASNTTQPGLETTQPGLETTSRAESTTTAKPGCSDKQCGGMTCLQLYNDYVCSCPINSFYMESLEACFPGESLYGEVLLKDREFDPNPASPQYTAIYKDLVKNFNASISNKTNFLGTVILEMGLTSARNARITGNVLAKVTNIFYTDGVNREQVEREIAEYYNKNNVGTYTAKTVCDSGWVCDPETTNCASDKYGYAVCTCKDGFYSSLLSYTTCRECSPDCTATNGKQCVQGKIPTCSCLSGYKSKDNKCEECSFGYSGVECADNFLLILVIVGSVLGGVVIILLGTVIGLAVRSGRGKGDSERMELITKDERRSPPASPAPASIFPKVTLRTDPGEVNRAANVYDDNEEYTRSIPQRDYDENPWYEMDRNKREY